MISSFGGESMIKNRLCALFALALAGCAGASATAQSQSAPLSSVRPAQIIVYPLAVDPADITLNQSVVQRVYRGVSGNENAMQLQVAHDTAANICSQVAAALNRNGYSAVCEKRGAPVLADNVLIVDGEFTNISEGNRLRRLVIGFGAGASTLDTSVQAYQRTGGTSRRVLDFTTHADSGKMPGAAVMGPAGAAASGSVAAAAGANVALGGVKSFTSSTSVLATKTAAQIANSVTQYYAQQGWAAERRQ